MKNQNSIFMIFCLSLTVGLIAVFSYFVQYFNNGKQYQARVAQLQKNIEQQRLSNTKLSYQLRDFQQTVAQFLPENKALQAKLDEKNLASAIRMPASEQKLDLSSVVFERGKRFFSEKDYDRAIKEFRKISDEYPLSAFNVESRFLTAESYYLKRDYKNSLQIVDEMVTLYPDNDLTGYILLRMGQMSEVNNQYDEASEIYRTVQKNFKNDKLKAQAKSLAKNLDYE